MKTVTFILQALYISPTIGFIKTHEEEREKNRYTQEDSNLMSLFKGCPKMLLRKNAFVIEKKSSTGKDCKLLEK